MAHFVINVKLPDDMVDPDHDTGLTQEGYEQLHEALTNVGATDIDTNLL